MAVNSLAQVATDELSAPPPPHTVAETGLSVDQIEQLIIKTLHTGELTGVTLAERICLPYSLLESLIERLRPSGSSRSAVRPVPERLAIDTR